MSPRGAGALLLASGLREGVDERRLTPEHLLTPAQALRDLPAVTVDVTVAAAVAVGKVLERDALGVDGDGPWPVLGEDGSLLAVYEPHRGPMAKPSVVLSAATSS